MTLQELKTTLTGLSEDVPVYHYHAGPRTPTPYTVFFEQPTEDFQSDNIHGEMDWTVDVYYYTKEEFPEYTAELVSALQQARATWRYDGITYLDDEDIIEHHFIVICAWNEYYGT